MEMEKMSEIARMHRVLRDANPHRPKYHLANPEGDARPFDANGGIYYNGMYHLFYIFQLAPDYHCWGHFYSRDLLHWQVSPQWIEPVDTDRSLTRGIFSGNAYLDKDGVPTILYHELRYGNAIQISHDPMLENWERPEGWLLTPVEETCDDYRVWDPCGWYDRERDTYYAVYGGKKPALFASKDGRNYSYQGPFITPEDRMNEDYEDYSCPDIFFMDGQCIFMFISHQRGWQYLIGDFDGERFHPRHHGRMNYPGGQFFAGESFFDGKGRRLLWAWVFDECCPDRQVQDGWSGVMSLPRELHLSPDGKELWVTLPEELEALPCNGRKTQCGPIRLQTEIRFTSASQKPCGVHLRLNEQEYWELRYENGKLILDASHVTEDKDVAYNLTILHANRQEGFFDGERHGRELREEGWKEDMTPEIYETGVCPTLVFPFAPENGEPLSVRIFLDGSIVEVFLNDRYAFSQRIYPVKPHDLEASVLGEGEMTLYDVSL